MGCASRSRSAFSRASANAHAPASLRRQQSTGTAKANKLPPRSTLTPLFPLQLAYTPLGKRGLAVRKAQCSRVHALSIEG